MTNLRELDLLKFTPSNSQLDDFKSYYLKCEQLLTILKFILTTSPKTLSLTRMINTAPHIDLHMSRLLITLACSTVGLVLMLRNGSENTKK